MIQSYTVLSYKKFSNRTLWWKDRRIITPARQILANSGAQTGTAGHLSNAESCPRFYQKNISISDGNESCKDPKLVGCFRTLTSAKYVAIKISPANMVSVAISCLICPSPLESLCTVCAPWWWVGGLYISSKQVNFPPASWVPYYMKQGGKWKQKKKKKKPLK